MNRILRYVTDCAQDLLDDLLPRLCTVCGCSLLRGEEVMCLNCRASLPVTRQYLRQPNDIHDRLISLRAPVVRATSFFYYHRNNPFAKLIHDTKYHRRPIVGRKLAAEHASQILSSGFFDGIDAIQPIPIHWIKRLRRTYNQSEEIARGIADVTGLPLIDNLKAVTFHTSQTRKSAEARKINTSGSFMAVRPEEVTGRHILIVDDVITTGSTMTEAMETLKRANNSVALSVFSLALTSNS